MTLQVYDHNKKESVLHRHTRHIVSITADITVSDEELIVCDTSGGAITVNLPTAALNIGREYEIKHNSSSANTVTLDAFGSETIDNELTQEFADRISITITAISETEWIIV